MSQRWWRLLSWVLLAGFLFAAGLNMAKVHGGFATNHLADLTGPAWLYIATRGLSEQARSTRIQRLLGTSPERAALFLFLASTATELSQFFWPTGLFPGRFDLLDIAAYAVGILPLYLLDRGMSRSRAAPVG